MGFTIHPSRVDNAQKDKVIETEVPLKKCTTLNEKNNNNCISYTNALSPGAIQKSNGLKVTCLMSLYFKSEEDTMKNVIYRLDIAPPPHTFKEKTYIYQMY